MVHTLTMDDLGSVLIPALAAVGGAGLTAIAGFVSSRERYSQRIERLASVREKTTDNALLTDRVDAMINYELSSQTFYKRYGFLYNTALFGIAVGYLGYVLLLISNNDRIFSKESSDLPVWLIAAFTVLGLISYVIYFAIDQRRRSDLYSAMPSITT